MFLIHSHLTHLVCRALWWNTWRKATIRRGYEGSYGYQRSKWVCVAKMDSHDTHHNFQFKCMLSSSRKKCLEKSWAWLKKLADCIGKGKPWRVKSQNCLLSTQSRSEEALYVFLLTDASTIMIDLTSGTSSACARWGTYPATTKSLSSLEINVTKTAFAETAKADVVVLNGRVYLLVNEVAGSQIFRGYKTWTCTNCQERHSYPWLGWIQRAVAAIRKLHGTCLKCIK